MTQLLKAGGLAVVLALTGSLLLADEVSFSTATGDSIEYNNATGVAVIEGNAMVVNATATLKADRITINMTDKEGHLEGNVVLEQDTGVIVGSEVFYNWERSTGVVMNAEGTSPPYYFTAQRMVQTGPERFLLYQGDFTTCDGDPPHYRIRSSKAKVHRGVRMSMFNSRFVVDEGGVFWTPFYTRSLRPKKYQLRVEPGSSGRDGLITKTTFGYPLTPNTMTKLRWDYLQYTGNGFGLTHQYFSPHLRGQLDGYYINDHNSDPQPKAKRYDINWDHFQQMTPRLTANARVNFKSDQTMGNQFRGAGSQGRVENSVKGLLSEGGFTYQFPVASLTSQFRRQDRFDSLVSSNTFIGKIVFPNLALTTIPLQFKYFPFYTSFTADYVNQTQDRFNPNESLRYQQSGSVGVVMRKDLRLFRVWNVTPRVGYTERWQNRDFAQPEIKRDQYQGRANTGVDVRRRVFRDTDLTFSQNYIIRMAPNQFKVDDGSNDRGVEINQLTTHINTRVGWDSRFSLSSGYDFRQAPRNDPDRYRARSSRIATPSLDIQHRLSPFIVLYFRESYSLYDPATRSSRRTPLYTSGDIQFGEMGKTTFFSQGFNFSKTAPGQESILYLNNKFRFFATPKWFVDGYLLYQLVGDGGMNYSRARPVEKTLRVVRDLHCWILRMEFSKRPDRSEASFYIDLKTNMRAHKNVFRQDTYGAIFGDEMDTAEVFPIPQDDTKHN